MNKDKARKSLALAASKKGYTLQVKAGKDADHIRILNSSKEVVASGTLALDASGYVISDVAKTVSQIRGQLPNALNSGRRTKMNASKSNSFKKMNAGCHGEKKMNASDDDVEVDETLMQDDAEFVDDVESIVTDEQGNEIVVDEMLVVQNPDTNEISLFVPTEEDDQVPEDVEVIGEVTAADDETTLDSSRRRVKMKAK